MFNKCEKDKRKYSEIISDWSRSTTKIISDLEAENVSLVTDNRKSFLDIENLKGDKLELQNLLKEEKKINQALIHRLSLKIDYTTTDSIEIFRTDTIDNYIWPTYRKVIRDPWYNAYMTMGKDTATLTLDMNLKMVYTYQWERRNGLFGLKTPIVRATTESPYLRTESIESVTIKEKPPRFAWNVTAGIGINTELKPVLGVLIGPGIKFRDF